MAQPHPIGLSLEPVLLALNNDHARELSWLEPERFHELVGLAFHARQLEEGAAFLLAFDQDAAYDNPNFRWFKARYPRFVYVDRIAVAAKARGRGFARRLYEDLFRAAEREEHDLIVCEVNADPPNPASEAFHASMGFEPVGRAVIHDGAKTVTYLARLCRI
jgi:predicted GNAT superfamily acetyltransferase